MNNLTIAEGKAILGIEFGSTRIKSVLIDSDHHVIASGSHEWENEYKDGIWTYSEKAIISGLQSSYADLKANVLREYGLKLQKISALGISAMMHGYLPFDGNMKLLVPFRTWRNTITEEASVKLTSLFSFNMPQRWSLSHLYQAILNKEEHVKDIRFLTTLAGWIHYLLSGRKVLGVGDASGMMPIDSDTCDYNAAMVSAFDQLIAPENYPWKLKDILPAVLSAGEDAGTLTEDGARLLDPDGDLSAGCPMCPPEGDAGTGMTATNSVRARTGNVSAGTSIFSMIVLDKPMSKVYPEIDIVTTPVGKQVGMVHCNSCTSDINAWISLFREFAEIMGLKTDAGEVYTRLFRKAMEGEKDCGGIVNFNYFAGEPVTGLAEGRPMFVRSANDKFNLANFMRAHLYGAIGVLKIGNDILFKDEMIRVDRITGHGGYFKTAGVGQRMLAAALNSPISVMETAGEGGAWGIALLAGYAVNNPNKLSLADYLENVVFAGNTGTSIAPTPEDVAGFEKYIENYKRCLPIEQSAVDNK